jgi:hypothetical protein
MHEITLFLMNGSFYYLNDIIRVIIRIICDVKSNNTIPFGGFLDTSQFRYIVIIITFTN